ncbi:MAG: helix-turn-helix transcriptional regulator [Sporocytophaga sp.]|nr:helix-turn-helix transcriptional regulator [Sporocytophaga sp.]
MPNKILALILLNPSINFVGNIITLSGGINDFPYVFFLAQITGSAFAPLTYIYIKIMTGKKAERFDFIYFFTIALMAYGVYCAIHFSTLSDVDQAAYLEGILHEPYPLEMQILTFGFIILQQIYFTLSTILVFRYRKNILNAYSNDEQSKVKFIVIFICLIWILNLISLTLYLILPMVYVEYYCLPIVLNIIYVCILYYSYHYNSIFTNKSYQEFKIESSNVTELSDEVSEKEEPVYDLSGLQEILDALELKLSNDKLYTNPELTINMLALEVGFSVKKISLCINKLLNKRFYEYINDKRIEYALILLKERSHYTIEAIAEECGFNSRSAFYRAFKKSTGVTPVSYMQKSA